MSEPGPVTATNRLRPRPALRAAVAFACGVVVASIAYLNCWQSATYGFYAKHLYTHTELGHIDRAINEYRRTERALPTSLSRIVEQAQPIESNQSGDLLDLWGNPYSYTVDGDSYELYSYAQDGAPGGIGINADIFVSEQQPIHFELATLSQFTFEMPTGGIKFASLISGICTAVACWIVFPRFAKETVSRQLLGWGLTLGFAAFVALGITAAHIPTGH